MFCKEVEDRIKLYEKKYNCFIIVWDSDKNYYMNVVAKDFSKSETDIKLCETDCNRYELATAIRNYFVK